MRLPLAALTVIDRDACRRRHRPFRRAPFLGLRRTLLPGGGGRASISLRLAYSMIFWVLAGLDCVLPTCAGQYCPSGAVSACEVGSAPESPAPYSQEMVRASCGRVFRAGTRLSRSRAGANGTKPWGVFGGTTVLRPGLGRRPFIEYHEFCLSRRLGRWSGQVQREGLSTRPYLWVCCV